MPSTDRSRLIAHELAAVDGGASCQGKAHPKHVRMAASPFRFFRGSAGLFYADLASGAARAPCALTGGLPYVRIQGDCHFSNFGFQTEEGSHSDDVIWCPNDYDDACVGHAAWDLARYAASLHLAAEHARGVVLGTYGTDVTATGAATDAPPDAAPDEAAASAAVEAFLDAYARTLAAVVEDPDVRYTVVCGFPKDHPLGAYERKARKRAAGGRNFAEKSSLAKAVDLGSFPLRFRDDPEMFRRLAPERADAVARAFRPYVDDAILDVVARVGQGTGSIGLDRFYLLVGPATADARRPWLNHVVEVKQQRPAAPLRHFPDLDPVNRLGPAHLTVDCQRIMQRRPDMVLDEAEWEGSHWLVRSRHHARVGLDPEDLIGPDPKAVLAAAADASGCALALAHARADRRSTDFEEAMAAALEDRATRAALAGFAVACAAQAIEDHGLLRAQLGGTT